MVYEVAVKICFSEGLVPAGRASELTGKASKPAGRASDPVERASERAGGEMEDKMEKIPL